MTTLANNIVQSVQVERIWFSDDNILHVVLSDGRDIGLPLERFAWLRWLLKATPEQRSNWSIEPGGFAIYWPELDDGIELRHLLELQPLS